MATSGAKLPTVGASVVRGGSSAWTSPGNVVSDNTTDTTVTVPADYLVTSGYGFSIPATATINGVIVSVEASESGTGNSNYIPQLSSDTTPTLIGAAKTAVTVSGTTKAISTNGSSTDLWSATLTPAIVNSSGFGVTIWSADTTNTLAIDYVTIEVYYTEKRPNEFPNPTLAKKSWNAGVEIIQSFVSLLGAPTTVQPGQRYSVAPVFKPRYQYGGITVAQSLLLTTLAVSSAVPRDLYVTELYSRKPQQPEQESSYIAGHPFAPFVQTDWQNPNPIRYPQQPQYLPRGIVNPVAATIPFAPIDIETPRGRVQVRMPEQFRPAPVEVVAAVDLLPSSQWDLPIPMWTRQVQQPNFLARSMDAAAPQQERLIRWDDQPNPTLAKRTVQPDHVPNLLENTLSPKLVAAIYWENPLPGPLFRQPGVFRPTPNPGAPVVPVDPLPDGRLLDQPVPVRARRVQQPDPIPNLLENTLDKRLDASYDDFNPFVRENLQYTIQHPQNTILYLPRYSIVSPSGGLTFSGTSGYAFGFTFSVSGGIVFSGTSPVIRTMTIIPSGGLTFGGSGSMTYYDTTGPKLVFHRWLTPLNIGIRI